MGKGVHHHFHLPVCLQEILYEANITGSSFKQAFVITNFMVHDLAENPLSAKDIDSNLYKTWFHYNGVATTARKHGIRLRRILLGPLPLNVTEGQRRFIELFNERSKLILVDDENGGFEHLDAFDLSMKVLKNQYLTSLNQPEVDDIIIPMLRDRLIDLILNRPPSDSNYSTLMKSTRYYERNGIYKLGPAMAVRPIRHKDLILPCVSTDIYMKQSSPGWPGLQLSICPKSVTDEALNLTAKVPIFSERVRVPGEWDPVVETAIVFSTAKPQFVIATPMFNVDSYAARNVFATLKATTGIWALDIVLDTCVDDTAKAVYNSILNYMAFRNHTDGFSMMCSLLCGGDLTYSSVHQPSACTSASVITRIRVITSKTTLLETRAENLAFSSSDPDSSFYISVQADMLVSERGWNFYLSLPLWVWPDEVSSAGTKDALNIPYRKDESDRNFSKRIIFPADVNRSGQITGTLLELFTIVEIVFLQCRFDLEDTDKFVVRDIANRGPLIFNGTKMRALGFFNERQFWLEDDETEFHVRAFYKYKWITGLLLQHI